MNPSATAYVPSAAITGALARRRPTRPLTPPLPPRSPVAASSPDAADAVAMTAAERLRRSGQGSAAPASAPTLHAPRPLLTSSTQHTAASTPVPPQGAAGVVRRYTRAQFLALQVAALAHITQGPVVDSPPFTRVPESFAQLLGLPYAMEYLDVAAAMQLVEPRSVALAPVAPAAPSSSGEAPDAVADVGVGGRARRFDCPVCAQGGSQPCPAVHAVVQRVSRQVMSTKLGAALMQPALVVASLLQLALVFDAKQSSLRLRMLAEQSPRIVHLVEEYLCGEGYHLPLPPVTAHEEWATLNALLRFNAIRDNKTRVITDLSKHWKKRRTQFEQFVHFFEYRTARPVRPAKNIITQSVKPGMVAMLMGDTTAMLLLHRLGFFIPPNYYWSVFPFLRQALGEGTPAYDTVRHLGYYLSAAQPADMYNPVERPAHG